MSGQKRAILFRYEGIKWGFILHDPLPALLQNFCDNR